MRNFLKYMLKPLAIISFIPCLGVFIYIITNRKDLLATSIILYLGLAIGNGIKYFYGNKPNA